MADTFKRVAKNTKASLRAKYNRRKRAVVAVLDDLAMHAQELLAQSGRRPYKRKEIKTIIEAVENFKATTGLTAEVLDVEFTQEDHDRFMAALDGPGWSPPKLTDEEQAEIDRALDEYRKMRAKIPSKASKSSRRSAKKKK